MKTWFQGRPTTSKIWASIPPLSSKFPKKENLVDRESQEGEPVTNALLNPSLAPQVAKARGGNKAPNTKRPTKTGPKQGKKKSKSKKKRAARDNLDTGLLAPMGLGF